MFPDMRNVLFRCFHFHKPRTKDIGRLNQRNFCKQQIFESPYIKNFLKNLNVKFTAFGKLCATQCNVVAAQRIRRTFQIIAVYRRLYGDHSLKRVLNELGSSLMKKYDRKSLFFLCGAVLFKWEDERIPDNELNSLVDDMIEIRHIEEDFNHHEVDTKGYLKSWEKIIDKDHFKLWRQPIPDSYLYKYKVYGTFYDVTPKCFLDVQIDLEYRKQWDNRVIKLDIIDTDDKSNTEVVQWITHFPYPMYSREYVYKRRYQVDYKKNVMVLSSCAVEHPKCPVEKSHVRVHTFCSAMVIKPHKTFDDNGFDYVMTYLDDPQAVYPSFCYSWLAKTGVPGFVDELHDAAKNLGTKRQQSLTTAKTKHPKESNTGPSNNTNNNSQTGTSNRQYC